MYNVTNTELTFRKMGDYKLKIERGIDQPALHGPNQYLQPKYHAA